MYRPNLERGCELARALLWPRIRTAVATGALPADAIRGCLPAATKPELVPDVDLAELLTRHCVAALVASAYRPDSRNNTFRMLNAAGIAALTEVPRDGRK